MPTPPAPIRRVLVLEAQTPFVHGGAEILARELVAALEASGYEAGIVSVPFQDHTREALAAHAAVWRLLDLTHVHGRPVDLVIPTKFPTYLVRHPAKVTWLVHQHRAAYELVDTPYSDFGHTERDVATRDAIVAADIEALGECAGLFSIARRVSARLARYNGLTAEPLYHPPRLAARLRPGPYGDYMLLVTRLEPVKRVDLAVRAFAHVPAPTRLVVAGDGTARGAIESLVADLGLGDRVTLAGRVSDDALLDLYAGARGVLFAPYDEDYGYVTLEAFLASKPVVTATDSGGTLEFVTDGVNGFVTPPDPEALAAAVARLADDAALAARLGEAGHRVAAAVSWTGVVDRLIGAAVGAARESA
jgi:glycosyltransferase involved in cell wall biosynthesis